MTPFNNSMISLSQIHIRIHFLVLSITGSCISIGVVCDRLRLVEINRVRGTIPLAFLYPRRSLCRRRSSSLLPALRRAWSSYERERDTPPSGFVCFYTSCCLYRAQCCIPVHAKAHLVIMSKQDSG
jgi:hypothetical protein